MEPKPDEGYSRKECAHKINRGRVVPKPDEGYSRNVCAHKINRGRVVPKPDEGYSRNVCVYFVGAHISGITFIRLGYHSTSIYFVTTVLMG
jgi:hypothetical protein